MPQSSVTLKNAALEDHVFLMQASDMKRAKYIDESTSLDLPQGLEISHDVKPAGQSGTDRHLVKVTITGRDSDGKVDTAVVSVQVSVPRNAAISETNVLDCWTFAKNYLDVSGAFAKIVDGITP